MDLIIVVNCKINWLKKYLDLEILSVYMKKTVHVAINYCIFCENMIN